MAFIENYCNNCLTDTLQIKGLCEPKECSGLYLNDFVDIGSKDLAMLANDEELSGAQFAESLIKRNAIKVITAIQTLMPDNYKVNRQVTQSCSTCEFNSMTASGAIGPTGITVKNITGSSASILSIESLKISTTSTGLEGLVIDDGVSPMVYPITLNGGVQQLDIPNYKTEQKAVKIYFQNPLVTLNAITCAQTSGCGCNGTKKAIAPSNYMVTGLLNGAETSIQYGFLPCVSTYCNFDYLICSLAKQNKQLIAYAMALGIHVDVLDRQISSDRLNKKTLNYNTETVMAYRDMQHKHFNEVIYGTLDAYGKPAKAGIKQIIEDTLAKTNDYCIECTATRYTSSVKV